MSRRVKVDCWCVMASSAMEGSATIRAPLLRAISRCISARSAASIPFALGSAARLRRSAFAAQDRCPAPGDQHVDARRCRVRPTARWSAQRSLKCPTIWVAFQSRTFLAEAVLVHGSHGQHDMGVGLGRPILGHVPMHIEVGDHALIDKLRLHEVAGEFDALGLRHLARKGELDLAGEPGVLPDLEG